MTLVDLFDVVRIVLIATVVIWYLAQTAGRIDRLNIRLDAARASLDLQLSHRAEVIAEVIAEGYLDPVSRHVLYSALADRRAAATPEAALLAESEISEVLRTIAEAHEGALAPEALQEELRGACNRVRFALAFHNDAVDATMLVRSKLVPKYLGLAGRTAWPEKIVLDDVPPTLVAAADS